MFRRLFSQLPESSPPFSLEKVLTDLHNAVSIADYPQVVGIVAEHPNLVNAIRGNNQVTALHIACMSFRRNIVDSSQHNLNHEFEMIRIVKFLISANAEVNTLDKFQRSPLLLAISQSRNLQLIKLLIFEGARLDSIDDRGNNVLHLAVSGQKDCLEITRLLVINNQLGLLKTCTNSEGKTAFDLINVKREIRDRVAVMALVNPNYSAPIISDVISPEGYEVEMD
ncbi:Hypothetical protein HVR_LOCUS753 [uncultured virus]|nr:Hypothetical protein HVR_LOCUS753 [uncultured virus]